MNVLLMLIGVLIVYLAIKLVFRYNWNKGLGVALEFEKKHVVNGETVNVVEVISNEKRLPLPCVNLKFQVDRELEFPGTDTNSSVSDLAYRNDVFSFLANQRITRRIPVKCNHRGVFKISGVQLTFAGPFMNEINVLKVGSTCEITVYPKTVDSKRFSFIRSRISGEAECKKYMLEDPFVFRGIRDYTSNDSLKNVNWKATARTDNLCVNEYNESVSRNVCILLNLEDDGMLTYDSVNEEAISLAASVAEELGECEEKTLVIGSDTVVVFQNRILGKPADEEDAVHTLQKLQDNTHQVYTGVTVLEKKQGQWIEHTFYEKTDVEFYPVSENEIKAYVSTGEPMDKAGSYGIQGKGFELVKSISGDYYSVMGLPIASLKRTLTHLGLI